MKRYRLPRGMRYSTLSEREIFYREEFSLEKVIEWFSRTVDRLIFAVIIGRHTGIYPEEYEDDASTTILIDEYEDLEDVRRQIIEFRPESVYYDRNLYDEKGMEAGQEVAFDIDPENITCPIHGTLKEKMEKHQGLGFCKKEFNMVKEETAALYEELEKMFTDVRIVYSGRGFHIHVLDPEAYKLTTKERKRLAEDIKGRGFHIDEWVTSGSMRLIRLPYSLHGMVSRIVIPLEYRDIERFDPVTDERCIPQFLRQMRSQQYTKARYD
ncbi:MAG: DNA primase [Nitrososphaerota archaeon]|nr:DNA primase [Nitrososphaerota archaeon]